MEPRGIRNNNPGNVDYHPSTDPWEGLDDPPSDGRFCRFVEPKFGIRVIAKLMVAYQDVHGCRSVAEIINRWAPPAENDTLGYVAHVADLVGVAADAPIDVHDPAIMRPLVQAIIVHENGVQPYDRATVDAGLIAAGIAA
jgi:hypothetical protein